MNTNSDNFSARLEYQITLNDFIEANDAYKKTSKITYYGYLTMGILGVLFGLVLLLLTNFYYYGGYALLFIGCLFILTPNLLHRITVKGVWKREPSIKEPHLVTISEDNFIVKTPNAETISNWEAYTKFIETKNLFLIFRQQNSFNAIPKRAFENLDTQNKFREFLKMKLLQLQNQKKA